MSLYFQIGCWHKAKHFSFLFYFFFICGTFSSPVIKCDGGMSLGLFQIDKTICTVMYYGLVMDGHAYIVWGLSIDVPSVVDSKFNRNSLVFHLQNL